MPPPSFSNIEVTVVAYVYEKLGDSKNKHKFYFLNKTSISLLASLFFMFLLCATRGNQLRLSWRLFSNICPFHQSGIDSLLKKTVCRQQHKESYINTWFIKPAENLRGGGGGHGFQHRRAPWEKNNNRWAG